MYAVAMAVSGVVNALVRIRLEDLVHTSYGWLVVCKAVALCLLGADGAFAFVGELGVDVGLRPASRLR